MFLPDRVSKMGNMLETEKLDAVIVSTPSSYHAEPTITAIERGLHVLVEKPMALRPPTLER